MSGRMSLSVQPKSVQILALISKVALAGQTMRLRPFLFPLEH